jgi:hypothetical protein
LLLMRGTDRRGVRPEQHAVLGLRSSMINTEMNFCLTTSIWKPYMLRKLRQLQYRDVPVRSWAPATKDVVVHIKI